MQSEFISLDMALTEIFIGQKSATDVNGDGITYINSKQQLCAIYNHDFPEVQLTDFENFEIYLINGGI